MNILITGASSGIGEALAVYYAERYEVAKLYICGRNKERLNKTKVRCEKKGAVVEVAILNVTDKEKMEKWVNECDAKGGLNLVIANAGVATLEEEPDNVFNTFEVNVFGVLNTIVPVIELYKKRVGGEKQIAILSSIAGYHGLASCPSYSASKACVKAYGEGLRGSLREFGIKVNVICPGFIRSRITDKNKCPMPFFMEAEEAARKIGEGLEKNKGMIAFPLPMRFAAWFVSVLPNWVSEFVYGRLPKKG